MGLGANFCNVSTTIIQSTQIDLEAVLGVKMTSQDRSPERLFFGLQLRDDLCQKCNPPKRKPHVCMFTMFENLLILSFKTSSKCCRILLIPETGGGWVGGLHNLQFRIIYGLNCENTYLRFHNNMILRNFLRTRRHTRQMTRDQAQEKPIANGRLPAKNN